jgi:hypothetical protein
MSQGIVSALRASAVVATLAATSCSNVMVERVRPDDYTTAGIRYWLPTPYLLVKTKVEIGRQVQLFRYDAWKNPPLLQEPCTNQCGATPTGPEHAVTPDEPTLRTYLAALGPMLAKAEKKTTGGGDDQSAGGKDSGNDGSGKDNSNGAGKDNSKSGGGKSSDAATSDPSSDSSPLAIVWLPDYCQQYAIRQKNVLSSQSLNLTLNDGWQLGGFQSSLNSTEVINKLLDTLGSVLSAFVSSFGGGGAGKAAGGAGDGGGKTKAQAAAYVTLKRIVITYLQPGVYPLFSRPAVSGDKDPCAAMPALNTDYLSDPRHTMKVTHWVQLATGASSDDGLDGGGTQPEQGSGYKAAPPVNKAKRGKAGQ